MREIIQIGQEVMVDIQILRFSNLDLINRSNVKNLELLGYINLTMLKKVFKQIQL